MIEIAGQHDGDPKLLRLHKKRIGYCRSAGPKHEDARAGIDEDASTNGREIRRRRRRLTPPAASPWMSSSWLLVVQLYIIRPARHLLRHLQVSHHTFLRKGPYPCHPPCLHQHDELLQEHHAAIQSDVLGGNRAVFVSWHRRVGGNHLERMLLGHRAHVP